MKKMRVVLEKLGDIYKATIHLSSNDPIDIRFLVYVFEIRQIHPFTKEHLLKLDEETRNEIEKILEQLRSVGHILVILPKDVFRTMSVQIKFDSYVYVESAQKALQLAEALTEIGFLCRSLITECDVDYTYINIDPSHVKPLRMIYAS